LFNQDATKEVNPGGSFQLGHYNLKVTNMEQGENDTYTWQKLTIDASRGSTSLGTLEPERRFYKASQQPTSEVAIRRRLNEDLYLNFAGLSNDNQRAVVQAYVFPLVSWIWIGFWVLAMGTLVCLIPSKVRLSYARTQVLGMAEKHAKVTS
jgi:cytochrome c-type biogenesis protein CcmF